ncbi:peptide ABC transporter substrate-binding protein [Betaproteobacteria bacterium PRO7]|jgi:ABC-type transport system substrate-binding protein|nr:peptide ABC transporter substrate-binding protein [Betaproteobacteria bacterium PRO7]
MQLHRIGSPPRHWLAAAAALALAACSGVTNSPHPSGAERTNTLFAAFTERSPRYLDPTASYSNDETPFTFHVYEPLFRFHYLKRPYELAPRTAEAVPKPRYLDRNGRELPADAPGEAIAESVYDIRIKKGILFAPHPAFAKDAAGSYVYHRLTRKDTADKYKVTDFALTGTRELTAHDYVYAIRRLATTRIKSPSFSLMSEYIIGLKEYGERIEKIDKELRAGLAPTDRDLPFLDFRQYDFPGAQALDDHTLRIRIKGKYPQFRYWLVMPFFAPVPWEADAFYAQPGMAEKNLTLNTWPVGTGPFMMTVYEENRRHVLERNPNFRGEPYPCEGEAEDKAAGLLADCGKPMPFIDRIVYTIEKEKIPLKAKFLQGFYDVPETYRFEYGIEYGIDVRDSPEIARMFEERKIKLPKTIDISNWYLGFNWLDPVVGKGKTPDQQQRNRKLRQALSIAIDWEEYVKIFETKASGVPAMNPVPPGVFGWRGGPEGINRVVYDVVDGKPVRKSLEVAKKLLAEAGYPDGRDAVTGKPLVLNYDYQRVLTPEFKSEVDWMVKQFAKLGVQLEVRATDYNRFQDKADKGSLQIFFWGWLADYPDAENFLFLLYGPNSKALTGGNGENVANYQNDEYDRLFEKLKMLDDGPEKQATIDRMVRILQEDAPWSFGYNPYAAGAYHQWLSNTKPTNLVKDLLLYYRLDPALRAQKIAEWNKPIVWPVVAIALVLIAAIVPAFAAWRRRERETAARTLAAQGAE